MGQNARQAAKTTLGWDRIAEMTENVYQNARNETDLLKKKKGNLTSFLAQALFRSLATIKTTLCAGGIFLMLTKLSDYCEDMC